jgi:hypothetical protein
VLLLWTVLFVDAVMLLIEPGSAAHAAKVRARVLNADEVPTADAAKFARAISPRARSRRKQNKKISQRCGVDACCDPLNQP